MKNPGLDKALATGNNHLAQPIDSAQLRNLLTTDVMAQKELPEDLNEIAELRKAIDVKLFHEFARTRLSDAEHASLIGGREDFSSVRGKWDSYILEVAQQYGARLFLSTLVMQRVWSWQCGEKDGPYKLKSLFHEMHRSALIGSKKATGRISSRHKTAKPLWIREITALQMQLREAFPETPDRVRQFVDGVIEASPGLFPNLKSNKASLLLFLGNDQRALAFHGFDFKRVKGDLTPTKFFAQWVAAAENHRSPELVRQYLSTR
jgi:hypothetical protein